MCEIQACTARRLCIKAFVGGRRSMLSFIPGGQIGKSGQMLQLSDMTFDNT